MAISLENVELPLLIDILSTFPGTIFENVKRSVLDLFPWGAIFGNFFDFVPYMNTQTCFKIKCYNNLDPYHFLFCKFSLCFLQKVAAWCPWKLFWVIWFSKTRQIFTQLAIHCCINVKYRYQLSCCNRFIHRL